MSSDSPTKVLFLCVANSCRSQMAEAVARSLDSTGAFQFDSCGAMPAGIIDSGVREYAASVGWDLAGQRSKGFDEVLPLDEYDAVVALCAEACVGLPRLPKTTKLLQWPFSDPTRYVGVSRREAYEKMRQGMEEKIKGLLDYLS